VSETLSSEILFVKCDFNKKTIDFCRREEGFEKKKNKRRMKKYE
jgi:hypothetical protein